MGAMFILNERGHDEVEWDPADEHSSGNAAAQFQRLRQCGYLPFGRARRGGAPKQLAEFAPGAEEIFWVRPLVGG